MPKGKGGLCDAVLATAQDLNATIHNLLGTNHQKLLYKFQGRLYRITYDHGNPIKKALA